MTIIRITRKVNVQPRTRRYGFSTCIAALLLSLSGISMTYAAPPSAPTGLCLQPIGNCASDTNVKKWHPGHYVMSTGPNDTDFPEIYKQPYILGVKVPIPWRTLEPSKGVYDFSLVREALSNLKTNNKRLFIMLQYKTFNKWALDEMCAPPDLMASRNIVLDSNANDTPTCISAIWRKPVADRLIALINALGQEFDNEPNLEGIVLPETSLGLSATSVQQFSFSNEEYKTQLKRIMSEATKAFPKTLIFQYANWLSDDSVGMKDLMEHTMQEGGGFGAPDLMPNRETTSSVYHKDYAGRMPLAVDNQRATQVGGGSVLTAYEYAVNSANGLHTNYIFWAIHNPGPWDFLTNIIPLITTMKGNINKECPSNIQCQQ